MNLMNAYIPRFVPKDLPWCEMNGLITWYDQGQCEVFLRDTDKHFREAKIINFDIIWREYQREEVQKISCNIIRLLGIKVFLSIQHLTRRKSYQAFLQLTGRTFFFQTENHKNTLIKNLRQKAFYYIQILSNMTCSNCFLKCQKIWVVILFYFIL